MKSYSVVIPVYNGVEVVETALRSVLDQTLQAKEIIVINDGSTDTTLKLLEALSNAHPQLLLIHNPSNSGVAYSRNRGVEKATGNYIAFLDADDRWLPEKMEQQLLFMIQVGLDFSYTGYTFRNEAGPINRYYSVPEHISFDSMLKENVIGLSTAVLKASTAKAHPMTSTYLHEDYVLWMELLQAGKRAGGLNILLMEYFVSKDSRSGNKKKAAKNRWKIYREALGLSFWKASKAFISYTVNGLKKQRSIFKGNESLV